MDFDYSVDSITPTTSVVLTISSTGALVVPFGTTAERPTPASGFVRYNTDLSALEFYNSTATAWQTSGNTETNGIAALSTTGIVTRTGSGTYTTRTIQGTTNRITLSNGSGVAGDPTIDIAATYVGQTSIITLGTITTGTWNGTTIGTTFGGTGLTSYAQGDLIYGSATNVLSNLVKDTNATRYLSNTGASNNPAWSQVNLANGVSGVLPFANLTQIAGLSVLGVTGTGTADVDAITGTANQIFRVNGAGTVLGFGSIDLSTTAAVGTSILGIANGGTGTTGGALADPGGNGVVVRTALNTTTNRTITGTAARITLTNGDGVAGNPTIDIAATYVGQTSITTLGTITTGIWTGTTIAIANGGTGQTTQTAAFDALSPTTTKGDLIVHNGTNNVRQPVGTDGFILTADSAQTTGVKWATSPSATVTLNNIQAATGSNSINNNDNAQTWNWALTTAAKTAFTFTENTAATGGSGSQFLVDISTIAASTSNPIRIRAQANNILTVTNVGVVTLQGADTGTGSSITIRGGNSSTAATGGANATLLGGTSGTSGTGGIAAVTGGVGGTTGVGGAANITGGAGGSTSGNAGGVAITGGTPVAGAGGSITISGSAGVGTNQAGGSLTFTGGNPTGTGTPGSISLAAGALQGAGTPATVSITGGAGNGATTGGAVTATAGSGGSTGTGAAITIRGGPGGSTSGAAGTVTVTGGTPVDGNGGVVTISGSAGVGTNRSGGNITLTAGAATGTGAPGFIDAGATTTAFKLPQGTDAQAPGQTNMPAAANGMLRFNTADLILQSYHNPYSLFAIPRDSGFQRTVTSRQRAWLVDEFTEYLNNSFVGALNFQIGGVGTEVISTAGTVSAGHIGVVNLSTGTTLNDTVYIHQGAAPTSSIVMANQVEYFAWLVNIPSTSARVVMFGLGQDVSVATTFGTNGVFFRYAPATSTFWQFITRSGSVSTTITTGTTFVGATWYLLEAYYDGTTWTPVVNGSTTAGSTTNIPTTAVNMGAFVQTLTGGAARSTDIDRFELITVDLGNRYP